MLANKVANNVTKAVNAMNSPEVSKEEKKVAMRELVAVLVLLVGSRIKLRFRSMVMEQRC